MVEVKTFDWLTFAHEKAIVVLVARAQLVAPNIRRDVFDRIAHARRLLDGVLHEPTTRPNEALPYRLDSPRASPVLPREGHAPCVAS